MVPKEAAMTSDPAGKRKRPSLIWPIVIVLATIFLMGVAAGYLDAMRDAGRDTPSALAGAGLVLAAGLAAMALYLWRVGKFWEGWSKRKRLYWTCLMVAVMIGVIAGILDYSGTSSASGPLFPLIGSGALPPAVAITLAILWAGGLAVLIPLYERSIDDHERQAYWRAGLAGYYAFIIPAPAWWVLHRAGLVPPLDAMLLFLAALLVNAAVYFWLKFR